MPLSRKQAAALIAANAAACETATEPRCVCACNGALHGMRHGLDWMREQVDRLAGPSAPETLEQPGLFSPTPYELRARARYFRERYATDPGAPNWFFTRSLELENQANALEDAQFGALEPHFEGPG